MIMISSTPASVVFSDQLLFPATHDTYRLKGSGVMRCVGRLFFFFYHRLDLTVCPDTVEVPIFCMPDEV